MENKDFILYKGYLWTRIFVMQNCGAIYDLTGYGVTLTISKYIGGPVLQVLTVGNGIVIDVVAGTATATVTGEQSDAYDTSGMPIRGVTEFYGPSCCDCGPNEVDTQIGPTGVYDLFLTDPMGNDQAPLIGGLIQIFSAV